MSSDGSRLARRMSRRRLLRVASGAVAAGVGVATGGSATAKPVAAMDVCFWRKQGSMCVGGTLMEQWCYVCCAGGDCETWSCEWREVGSC